MPNLFSQYLIKRCDIFWLNDGNGLVSAVFYEVRSKKKELDYFVEIEVDKGEKFIVTESH